MAIWIESSPPFVWRPKIERAPGFVGFMWGWLRVGRIAYDFNSFVQGLARAGAEEARERIADSSSTREKP